MPAPTMPTGVHAIGPGYLYWGAIGTAEPTSTVAASIFTDTWTGWTVLGYTDGGHVFTYDLTVDAAEAAEAFDPLAYATTARRVSIAFALLGMTAANLKKMLNGGTITVTGTTGTTKSVYTPPDPGSEVRCLLGWESTSLDERIVARQCYQGGTMTVARSKGAAARPSFGATFNLEVPATGLKLFDYITAGTVRA